MSGKGSAKSAWSDEVPATRIDRDAFLYMGSDPAWTPAREYRRPRDEDAADGDCILCGGVGALVIGPGDVLLIHRDVPDGSHRVCARCMRYGRERHEGPGLPDDPDMPTPVGTGYVSRRGVTIPEKFARLMKG